MNKEERLRGALAELRSIAKDVRWDWNVIKAIASDRLADTFEAELADPTLERNVPPDVCPECTLGPPNWAERKEGHCAACNDTGRRPLRTAKQVVDEWRSTGSQDWEQLASAIDYWAMNDFCPRFMGERK
jgi:hypothetical protein